MTTHVDRAIGLLDEVRSIAREVAAVHADDVDRNARFPSETIQALRDAEALSAFVPAALGGQGVSLETLAACCRELGRCCGASAMVFAMHQIQVVSLVRHSAPGSSFDRYLSELARSQRLIASVTSEVGTGGDMGRSIAALSPAEDGEWKFEKQAPTVSYAEYADDLLITLRSSPEAEAGDQVLALSRRADTTLTPTGSWDVLGMRGTCSPGYVVAAQLSQDQVLSVRFAEVAAQSMVPVSHILWSHLWLGIAEDAFERARSFVKAAAKRSPGELPPVALRLSRVSSELSMLRALVELGLRDYLDLAEGERREELMTMASVLRFNNLKLAAS
ncbi:MAG TPA: acyl-CoA dehydrogenase family protein, partial [Solirubrobacteraceae bacterium]|nr:acyl-CoA dehydrogenase family protein [Solirubrobacteraceae bacterium]